MTKRSLAVLLAALFAAATAVACGRPGSRGDQQTGGVSVVATTTVIADLAANVGGPNVRVTSLVPRGGEVHTYDPSPGAVAAVADADLVLANGLGLDAWATELVEGAGSDAPVVQLAVDLAGVTYLQGDSGDEAAGAAATVNPHLWLDVGNARLYVRRIAEALVSVDPEAAGEYRDAARAYDAKLAELDGLIRRRIGEIPPENRRIVSFHEAFPYFARAYGLEVVGVIVDAPGQDPSAGEMAELVEQIRASGARAVFAEAQFDDRLARTIADEAGATVESRLYSDSLGDPPADTYVGMMTVDTDRIVAALR